MDLLGLSFDYHDAAAVLLRDGVPFAATEEERLTRIKHDPELPREAMRFCLEQAGAAPDGAVFYERPLRKLENLLRAPGVDPERRRRLLDETLADWFANRRFEPQERIAEQLGLSPDRVHTVPHHAAHAASAFYCSPFEEAAVVAIDGVGEDESTTIWHGRGTSLTKLASVRFPHSLGLLYSAFTAYLGFEVNEGEYKVMGMAGFGRSRLAAEIAGLIRFTDDGYEVAQEHFDFLTSAAAPFLPSLTAWLGPAREPEARFDPDDFDDDARRHADIAASLQRCVEDAILRLVDRAMRRTGLKDVCLAGGVALNSVANGRIRRELGCRLYVQPAAGDAGGALGAALHHWHQTLGRPRGPALTSPYLGRAFAAPAMLAAIRDAGLTPAQRFDDTAALTERVADLLAAGKVIGWFQGRAEWGPRALGARSILANPALPEMKGIVNEKIKFREPFRPFAPSVLEERAREFFDIPETWSVADPEYFMLAVHDVRPDKREAIPAVVHADGSARVHLVNREVNPAYHALIAAFARRTGVPMLLNTSFNLRGEPIVDSPANAIDTFRWSGLDHLVLGPYLLSKEEGL